MLNTRLIVSAILICSLSLSSAQAHPGSKILHMGGAKQATAMSKGMSYQDINGVHLFQGSPAPAQTVSPDLAGKTFSREIEIKSIRIVRRSFRPLRTQGFYSGHAPKGRRFTQGFYSGL